MSPVAVNVPVGCAKATLQNDRSRSDTNAANLLVIFVSRFLLGTGLVGENLDADFIKQQLSGWRV